MESNKKWGWSIKTYHRYYRKIYMNNYDTLTRIYTREFIHDILEYRIFGKTEYRFYRGDSCYKKITNRKFRFGVRDEIKRIVSENNFENDSFPKKKQYFY